MQDAPQARHIVKGSGAVAMHVATSTTEGPSLAAGRAGPRWPARFALRLAIIYVGLYVLTTQMLAGLLLMPVGRIPNLGELPPVTTLVEAVAARLFGATLPLVITGSGSGDKTYDWVHAFVVLVVALVVSAAWTARARAISDLRLHRAARLFVRFALGSTLVVYGAVKAVPLQMPSPSLNRLLERFGDFSPMGVLWASIGASPAYEMLTGAAELGAGILLFIPHTAAIGALASLGVTLQVFTLNMTYDVPVKLFSFHLVLMSLFLLAPDLRRLAHVLVLNREALPSPLAASAVPGARRLWLAGQVAFGAYLVAMNLYGAVQAWHQYGGGAPRSPLYGIWDIEAMRIDGHLRAPLVTDVERWRRVTFDRPTSMSFLRMDDSVASYVVTIDEASGTVALTRPADAGWKATLDFTRPAPDALTLAGEIDGRALEMRLRLLDRSRFLLVTRGFHWVQEYPFNR